MDASGVALLMLVVGPAALALVLLFAIRAYRRRRSSTRQHTEAATERLYQAGAQEERRDRS